MKQQETPGLPYLRHGFLAGALGAGTVALFFLVVDLISGRPLATPSALGATLFLAEPFDLGRTPSAALVAGYTAIHSAIFVALASITAALLLGAPRPAGSVPGRRAAALATVFFVGSTAVFFGFTALWEMPEIWSELGAWRVLAANAVAAFAMAVPLARLRSFEPDSPRRENTAREAPDVASAARR